MDVARLGRMTLRRIDMRKIIAALQVSLDSNVLYAVVRRTTA